MNITAINNPETVAERKKKVRYLQESKKAPLLMNYFFKMVVDCRESSAAVAGKEAWAFNLLVYEESKWGILSNTYNVQKHGAIWPSVRINLSLPQWWWVFHGNTHYSFGSLSKFCFSLFKWQTRGTRSCSQHYHGVSTALCFPTGSPTRWCVVFFFLNK